MTPWRHQSDVILNFGLSWLRSIANYPFLCQIISLDFGKKMREALERFTLRLDRDRAKYLREKSEQEGGISEFLKGLIDRDRRGDTEKSEGKQIKSLEKFSASYAVMIYNLLEKYVASSGAKGGEIIDSAHQCSTSDIKKLNDMIIGKGAVERPELEEELERI